MQTLSTTRRCRPNAPAMRWRPKAKILMSLTLCASASALVVALPAFAEEHVENTTDMYLQAAPTEPLRVGALAPIRVAEGETFTIAASVSGGWGNISYTWKMAPVQPAVDPPEEENPAWKPIPHTEEVATVTGAVAGDYVCRIGVTDELARTAQADCRVHVLAPNTSPLATAGDPLALGALAFGSAAGSVVLAAYVLDRYEKKRGRNHG